MFERAIALDPEYAEAYAFLSFDLLDRVDLAMESEFSAIAGAIY